MSDSEIEVTTHADIIGTMSSQEYDDIMDAFEGRISLEYPANILQFDVMPTVSQLAAEKRAFGRIHDEIHQFDLPEQHERAAAILDRFDRAIDLTHAVNDLIEACYKIDRLANDAYMSRSAQGLEALGFFQRERDEAEQILVNDLGKPQIVQTIFAHFDKIHTAQGRVDDTVLMLRTLRQQLRRPEEILLLPPDFVRYEALRENYVSDHIRLIEAQCTQLARAVARLSEQVIS